jgi:serine/threonine protein kinase
LGEKNGKWSANFHDLIDQALLKSAKDRPTCTDLLKHPFFENAEEYKDDFI